MNPEMQLSTSSDYEKTIMPGLLPSHQQILNWLAANGIVFNEKNLQEYENDSRNPESWINKELTKTGIHLAQLHELIQVMRLREEEIIALKEAQKDRFDFDYEPEPQKDNKETKKSDAEMATKEQIEKKPEKHKVSKAQQDLLKAEKEVSEAVDNVKNKWSKAAEDQAKKLGNDLDLEIEKLQNLAQAQPDDKKIQDQLTALKDCKAFVKSKPVPREKVEKVYAKSLKEFEQMKWKGLTEQTPAAPTAPSLPSLWQKDVNAAKDPVVETQLNLREALMTELLMKFKADRTAKVLGQPQQVVAGSTQTSLQEAHAALDSLSEKREKLYQAKTAYAQELKAEKPAAEKVSAPLVQPAPAPAAEPSVAPTVSPKPTSG